MDELNAALKAYDDACAKCPIRSGRSRADTCPDCGATARESCRLDIREMISFIDKMRALAASPTPKES